MRKLGLHLIIAAAMVYAGVVFAERYDLPADLAANVQPSVNGSQVESRKDYRHHWRSMTDEQRQAFKQKMLNKWQNMSDADKAKMQKRMSKRWDKASPEEKQYMREKMVLKIKAMPEEDRAQLMSELQGLQ
ncbi:MAG: hypothetical protein CMF50_09725 [Legionellales bacterium]|nr:hypothetical protein [Legionellales bacterium]|tara:strand:+ start:4306 stop:4698 length:393 start_codon:yes stop_codon:yes gene_type:complete